MAVEVLHRRGQPWSHLFSRPSLLGDGLLERARSTSFAMLGLTAAVGLSLVALALNQSWPLLPGGPIPGAAVESALHEAVVAAQPPAAKRGSAAPSVAATAPARIVSSTAARPLRHPIRASGPGGAQAGGSHGLRLGAANEVVPASIPSGHFGGRTLKPPKRAPKEVPLSAPPPAVAPEPAPRPLPVAESPAPPPVAEPESQPGNGKGHGHGNGRGNGNGNGQGKGNGAEAQAASEGAAQPDF